MTKDLGDKAPKWVSKARWYFENSHREVWVAIFENNTLVISGEDIDWAEIKVSPSQAQEYVDIFAHRAEPTKSVLDNPLMKWVLSEDERIWVESLIKTIELQQKFCEGTSKSA